MILQQVVDRMIRNDEKIFELGERRYGV